MSTKPIIAMTKSFLLNIKLCGKSPPYNLYLILPKKRGFVRTVKHLTKTFVFNRASLFSAIAKSRITFAIL